MLLLQDSGAEEMHEEELVAGTSREEFWLEKSNVVWDSHTVGGEDRREG